MSWVTGGLLLSVVAAPVLLGCAAESEDAGAVPALVVPTAACGTIADEAPLSWRVARSGADLTQEPDLAALTCELVGDPINYTLAITGYGADFTGDSVATREAAEAIFDTGLADACAGLREADPATFEESDSGCRSAASLVEGLSDLRVVLSATSSESDGDTSSRLVQLVDLAIAQVVLTDPAEPIRGD